jgi:hypothetical protein
MKQLKRIMITAVIILLVIFFGPYQKWLQCEVCGVQQYERGIFRIMIRPISEIEYDEYGTYAEWKELNQKDHCDHRFKKVKNNTTKQSLDELKQK